MKSVLLTCYSRSWGGMEMFTLTTAEQLRNAGITAHISTIHGCRLETEAREAGFTVLPVEHNAFLKPAQLRKLQQFIKLQQVGLIHAQASKDLWVLSVLFLFSRLHIPLLFTKHVGSYIVKKDLLHRFAYKPVSMAFGVSKVIVQNLLDTTPLTKDRVSVLHNGVDLSRFNFNTAARDVIRRSWNVTDDTIIYGMTARFSPGKGHEVFIQSAAEAYKQNNNLLFIIVGEASRGEDEYAQSIRKMAETSGAPILFTGFRKDIPEVLSALDVFVFPSHAEAFGISLIEAMAIGLPSIVTAADGALDIAIDNETSLLFGRGEAPKLRKHILTLAADKQLRTALGTKGRNRAIEHFSLTTFTERLLASYRQFGFKPEKTL